LTIDNHIPKSFPVLIAQSIEDEIKHIEREYKLKGYIVDCLIVLNSNKIIVL